jgi:hypothetical protein
VVERWTRTQLGTGRPTATRTWTTDRDLRRLVILLVPLALVACGSPNPSSLALASPRVGPSGLLVRLDIGWDKSYHLGRHSADYLADGTVIRWSPVGGKTCNGNEKCGVLERNTLTASGLAALRTVLAKDADLLSAPTVIERRIAPNQHPLLHGDIIDAFILEHSDGSRYRVAVPSTTSTDAPTWVPDPAVTRLNALAETLLRPETLGAGSLADPAWVVYQPTTAAVIIRPTPAVKPVPFDGPFGPDMQQVGWPLGDAPDVFGAAFTPKAMDNWGTTGSFRCAFLANDATLMPSAGSQPPSERRSLPASWSAVRVGEAGPCAGVRILTSGCARSRSCPRMYLEPATTPSPGEDTGRDAVMRILMKVDSTNEASKWVALAPKGPDARRRTMRRPDLNSDRADEGGTGTASGLRVNRLMCLSHVHRVPPRDA